MTLGVQLTRASYRIWFSVAVPPKSVLNVWLVVPAVFSKVTDISNSYIVELESVTPFVRPKMLCVAVEFAPAYAVLRQ